MEEKDLAPVIIGKLLNIGGMLQRKANQLLGPFDLNQQQFSLLFEIDRAGRVNQTTMVNRLVLEKAHVSKIVKKLSAMGLINVGTAPEDKRSTWLTITPKGQETVKQCRQLIRVWNKEWAGTIDSDRLQAILDDLAVLQAIFGEKLR
jgi:DNA-binding MarR family transcriptional regulator